MFITHDELGTKNSILESQKVSGNALPFVVYANDDKGYNEYQVDFLDPRENPPKRMQVKVDDYEITDPMAALQKVLKDKGLLKANGEFSNDLIKRLKNGQWLARPSNTDEGSLTIEWKIATQNFTVDVPCRENENNYNKTDELLKNINKQIAEHSKKQATKSQQEAKKQNPILNAFTKGNTEKNSKTKPILGAHRNLQQTTPTTRKRR